VVDFVLNWSQMNTDKRRIGLHLFHAIAIRISNNMRTEQWLFTCQDCQNLMVNRNSQLVILWWPPYIDYLN